MAEVVDASDFQMSGPMTGRLKISNGIEEENCGVSLVWPADSKYLAIPKLFPEPPHSLSAFF